MASTTEPLRQWRAARIRILIQTGRTERKLVAMWGTAWAEVVDEWRGLVNDILEQAATTGEWPSRTKLARMKRAANALHISQEALDTMVAKARIEIAGDLAALVAEADDITRNLIGSQLPPEWDQWTKPSQAATEAIVRRATEQVTVRTYYLSKSATAAMKSQLIRGVQMGDNPRVVARQMVKRVEGAFNGGIWRARNIARTEMLDAYRAADRSSRVANVDILTGWMWLAELSSRTCPGCLSMHGRVFPPEWDGPNDHPSGRCTSIPITKTWAELGFTGLDEPAPVKPPDAEEWFNRQSGRTQTEIMGKARLEEYQSGRLKWGDMAELRQNPDWRPSWGAAPVGRR